MAIAELKGRKSVAQSQSMEVPKLRIATIIACSVLIMLCAGAVYAWSIFVTPLKTTYGLSTAATQLIYGCSLATLGIGLVALHPVYRKFGPRITASAGAVIFCAGFLLASFSQGNVYLLLLGISILTGIGMGLGYITVLSNLVLWMPQHKGLAAGIAVAGFGGGSVLMTQISIPLLNNGMDVLSIFRIIGIVYGVLFFIGASFLSSPQGALKSLENKENRVHYRKLFTDRRFWVLFYAAFAASFGGLMFYGNAKPLGISFGISAGAAVMAVMLMSIGNAIGRLTWGQVSDMIGPRKSILLSLVLVTALMPLMLIGIGSDFSFVVLILAFGFCFGADQVLYASNVAAEWGPQKFGVVYPLVFLAYAVAALIAPTLGGRIFDVTNSYTLAIIISTFVCFSGLPVYFLLMPHKKSLGQEVAAAKGAPATGKP